MPAPRYISICNPDGKRWQAYAKALAEFWDARHVNPEIVVVPWKEIIPRQGNLDGLFGFDQPALVRLESPGRDFEVTKALMLAGEDDPPSAEMWRALPHQKGRLLRPSILHRGFCRVLQGLRRAFDARPHLTPLACPLAIAELFDKNATSARLTAAGIPCPPSLVAPADFSGLIAAIRAAAWPTAYVKLATGSSATGTAVVHALNDSPWAVTTMVSIDGWFCNTRRLQRISGDDLHRALDFILHEGSCVQRGIPMAQIDGQNFDVRVVVIHGQPTFTIFRLSRCR